MLSSVVGYRILGRAEPAASARTAYLCEAPDRLGLADQVLLSELAGSFLRLTEVSDLLRQYCAVASDHLLVLHELLGDEGSSSLFLASEAPSRGTLANATIPLEPQAKVLALAAAARGAHALHEVGIAHGTISPDAIFLTGRGPVLGPPDMVRPAGKVTTSKPAVVLNYVDPALLRGEAPSRASDIWSLGASLHMSLSNTALYPGLDDDEPVIAVQRVLYSRPRLDPGLPAGILDVIRSCMASDMSERPPTAIAIASILEGYEFADLSGPASKADLAEAVSASDQTGGVG